MFSNTFGYNSICSCQPEHRGGTARNMMKLHYDDDVIMSLMASQITSLMIVYSTVYSGADQRKHKSSASLAFLRGIHRGPVNSPHKWPVTRKMFRFDDVIMIAATWCPNLSMIVVKCRGPFVYAPSQWKTTLQCNVVSHWLDAYTKWSLEVITIYYDTYLYYWVISTITRSGRVFLCHILLYAAAVIDLSLIFIRVLT